MTSFDEWNYLAHHGIKGQKWGVRRYQNEDGTLTTLGKLRGGHEARKENRILKKTIADDEKYGKEWRQEKTKAIKRAIKDDNYRKTVAKLEAHRLKMDPKETEEMMDAHLAGERAADNIMWYKYGDRGYNDIVGRQKSKEKIASLVLKKLEKRGLDIEAQGKQWQKRLDAERGIPSTGKNAFEGDPAHATLSLLQAQRQAEKYYEKRERKMAKKNKGG